MVFKRRWNIAVHDRFSVWVAQKFILGSNLLSSVISSRTFYRAVEYTVVPIGGFFYSTEWPLDTSVIILLWKAKKKKYGPI